MEIERVAVALRLRGIRESMDLGSALLRRYGRPIWQAWFAVGLPCLAVAMAVAALTEHALPALLLLWWLKPLFARIPLFVLSRATFGDVPDWRAAVRGMSGWKLKGLFGWMTLGRFDARRAARQPLVYLEGLGRKAHAQRWRVFGRNLMGASYALTFGCMAFEVVLTASVLLFVPMLVPFELWPGGSRPADWFGPLPVWFNLPLVVAYYLAITVCEPLYTACGFALYLSRRTELEAWDIDLAFRRIRQRLSGVAALVAVVLLALSTVSPARAATDAVTTPMQKVLRSVPADTDRRVEIETKAVFADPLLGGSEKRKIWVPKNLGTKDDTPATTIRPAEARMDAPLGAVVKYLLIAVLAVGVIALAWTAIRRGMPARVEGEEIEATPEPSRIDETPLAEALPTRLGDVVATRWREGRRRDALALLYRATVEQMATALDKPVSADATEADAIAQARRLDDEATARDAVRIVRTWQFAAYADRYPSDDEMASLLSGWPVTRS